MKITVAGTGYVGLVTGVCLAARGHDVTCTDVVEEKIAQLNAGTSPIYEDGLDALLRENRERLTFTTDAAAAYRDAEVIIIGVGTPEKKDGSANLSYLFAVVDEIAASAERDCVVIVKSTVPIGTNDRVEARLRERVAGRVKVDVVSNPEFLAQGTAVRDTLAPSRIVIGAENADAAEKIRAMYAGFDAPVLVMNRRSAEMVKYASNDFLALKISYINEIANVCEVVGADIDAVSVGMGYDPRIGNRFLRAGIGYGGSCFPKDTKALYWLANFLDCEIKTVKAAIEVNENQKLKLLKKSRRFFDSLAGRRVAVLGLTFKPGTDDLRDGPALTNVPLLLEEGARVAAWDAVGEKNFRRLYPTEVEYCARPEDALSGAELCFIFTEWPQVKALPPETFLRRMLRPIVLDGRNCYDVRAMRSAGVEYVSIGR
ncbi:MAG TPA: UDP-glucose/GDP-mannose dehydrogenase family protein [Candidatus Spyradosoma merdigallinarum]|uniref:UDP-glucose 6-dehydrogenase n=1 Tax=Candidatus Spyradosoma merdigallinarum TaxID=2840950 RepID=A0A9D1NK96_9BACT|nr:UDP-glucose/GDP-mannose dehydrogenase family protein [Candidatus Spyradosoma merdigallinarum]